MAKAISLRGSLRWNGTQEAREEGKGCPQVRRLLALASIYDGGSRRYASEIGGVTVQIVRDWVLRLNERGPGGLINGRAPGGRAKRNEAQRQALAKIVESGPIPAVHGVVRWRRRDLVQWLFQEFQVSIDETTVGRELKALGFAKLSARQGSSISHGRSCPSREYQPGDRASAGGGDEAEGEDIAVLEIGIDEALAMVGSGAIRDGKTIMLLQYAALNLFYNQTPVDVGAASPS